MVVFVRLIAILDNWNAWLLVVMLVAAFLSETKIAIKPTGEEYGMSQVHKPTGIESLSSYHSTIYQLCMGDEFLDLSSHACKWEGTFGML